MVSIEILLDRLAEDKIKGSLRDWRVGDNWFGQRDNDCRFMHCLPVRRGVTVTDSTQLKVNEIATTWNRLRQYSPVLLGEAKIG